MGPRITSGGEIIRPTLKYARRYSNEAYCTVLSHGRSQYSTHTRTPPRSEGRAVKVGEAQSCGTLRKAALLQKVRVNPPAGTKRKQAIRVAKPACCCFFDAGLMHHASPHQPGQPRYSLARMRIPTAAVSCSCACVISTS